VEGVFQCVVVDGESGLGFWTCVADSEGGVEFWCCAVGDVDVCDDVWVASAVSYGYGESGGRRASGTDSYGFELGSVCVGVVHVGVFVVECVVAGVVECVVVDGESCLGCVWN